MRDIAQAAGVSQPTVSRILMGGPTVIPIRESTRERVLTVAREMNYEPNPLARALRGARTMLLGVIVRDITDPFFTSAIDAITTAASTRGYNVVLGHAHGHASEAIALQAVLETRHCDAIVLLGDLTDRSTLLDDLLRRVHPPVVGLCHGAPLPGLQTVNVNNAAGTVAAVDHLVGLGHTELAFVEARFQDGRVIGDIERRCEAFHARLAALGFRVRPERVLGVPNDAQGGADAFERLMRLPDPPTAVVASTDTLAIGALNAAYRLGLDIPGDVSVVGFDDLPICDYLMPPLTTVRQPIAEMAAAAVEAAIAGDDGTEAETGGERVLAPRLVIRESTGPVPAPRAVGPALNSQPTRAWKPAEVAAGAPNSRPKPDEGPSRRRWE